MRKLLLVFAVAALAAGCASNKEPAKTAGLASEPYVNLASATAAPERALEGVRPTDHLMEGEYVETTSTEPTSATYTTNRGNRFGMLCGFATGPFDSDEGIFLAGFLNMSVLQDPLIKGRLSGEIMASWSRHDQHYKYTQGPLDGALLGPGGVDQSNNVDVTIDVISILLGIKYNLENLGPFKPFFVTGMGIHVFELDCSNGRVAGIAPEPLEFQHENYPKGNAETEIGWYVGGGLEIAVFEWLGVLVDARYHVVDDADTDYFALGGGLNFRF